MAETPAPDDALNGTPNGAPRLWGKHTALSMIAALGVMVAMVLWSDLDFGAVASRIADCDKGLVLLALLAHYATYPVRGARWKRSLSHLLSDEARRGRFGLLVFFYNFVDNLVPAKLGDVYGAHLARINLGLRRSAALGSIVFLRMIDAWVVLGLAVGSSVMLFSDRLPTAVVWPLIGGAVLAGAVTLALIAVLFLRHKLPAWLPEIVRQKAASFDSGAWPRRRQLLPICGLTLAIWALETVWIAALLWAFGLRPSGAEVVFLTMIPLLATTFPLTPSGAGIVELTLMGSLLALGVPKELAASILVVNRVIDYWLHLVLGLMVWALRGRLGLRAWFENKPSEGGLGRGNIMQTDHLTVPSDGTATAAENAIRSVLLLRVSSVVDKVDHPQFFDPSYQLKYIQAYLETWPDVDVTSHDCWIEPLPVSGMVELVRSEAPDMVVISSSSFDLDVSNELVAELRALPEKSGGAARLIVGIGQGHYLNQEPSVNAGSLYDAILLGEPEAEFQSLFESARSGESDWRAYYRDLFVKGKRFLVEDLDALPFPNYTREELEAYRSIYPVRVKKRVIWGFLIAGRGCPYACTFCSEVMRVSIGTKMRIRSGANVADEMEHLVTQGANIISFQDDSFSSSKRLMRSVCEELIARGSKIPWMCRVRADEVDRDILVLMKQAGCVMLGIGVEAASQRVIDRVRKVYRPTAWAACARQTFKWTRELGIGTNAYYVLGNPGETREEMEATIDLALELNADSIQVHFHTPYPGSADWNEYHNTFVDFDPTKMFHYARPVVTLAEVTPDELMDIRAKFYKRYLYRPGFALRHLWHHAGFYLRNPDIFWTLVGIRKVFGKDCDGGPAPEPPARRKVEQRPKAAAV